MTPEQDTIVSIISKIYDEIFDIEQEYKLLMGDGDFRPRIDYFHDAIRAFVSGTAGERLSVEHLAYDIEGLRYLQATPLGVLRPHSTAGSPAVEVINVGFGQELAAAPKRLDRTGRSRLSELYQHYAVLFSALMKAGADEDFIARTEDLNQDVKEMNAIIAQIAALASGKGSVETAAALAGQVEDANLHKLIIAFLQQKRYTRSEDVHKLTEAIKREIYDKDKRIKGIDQAHMRYAMAQLAVYEASKDVLKSMAQKGMNLVGKFVEASVAQTRQDRSR
ncbi:MAG: hypothetical protein EBR02_03100 [Alphaproteobacteria bacterium]|nr:hypothetical protein [Alphaproteobacteria bacterium]